MQTFDTAPSFIHLNTEMNEAIAFKGPNDRIIELVFEDKNEDYFDYLIQDVLPKFEEMQLRKIAPYIERYSVIDLTQRKYDYRYLQVFFYCSPRTEFESLLMRGNHIESQDIRNLVKALDSRQVTQRDRGFVNGKRCVPVYKRVILSGRC